MKRRVLPLWTVRFAVTHESFGGNTHRDGEVSVRVRAASKETADKRALAEAKARHGKAYDYQLLSTTHHNEH